MSHAIQQEFNAGRASSSMIADTIHHAPLLLTPVREIQERSRTYQGHDFEENDGVHGRIWNIKPLPAQDHLMVGWGAEKAAEFKMMKK